MKSRKFTAAASSLAALCFMLGTPAIGAAASNSNAGNKITICHATGSTTNPFVSVTADANGVINGHVNHQDTRDIIPPFSYNDHGTTKNFPGQNWDAAGQAILNNGCKAGGSGGGGGGGTTGGNGQVLGATTSGGQGGGAVGAQAANGAVGAGFGGAAFKVNEAAVLGLVASAVSVGSGVVLFNNRRKV